MTKWWIAWAIVLLAWMLVPGPFLFPLLGLWTVAVDIVGSILVATPAVIWVIRSQA